MSLARLNPVSAPFRDERIDLAAAFRWTARLNMHEAVANHFSLAVSPDGRRFLVNPNGRHFSRLRASDMVLLDADDPSVMEREDAPDPTAWFIHGAIHRRAPQARCIMHVHSKYATALACLADSTLPPIDQNTMRFFGRVAIDSGFEGFGFEEEAERMADLLGNRSILVLGNHGVLVTGISVALAFDELYYFERACETYITALSTGRPLRIAPDAIAAKTAQQWQDYPGLGINHFNALKEILDAEEPDYRD